MGWLAAHSFVYSLFWEAKMQTLHRWGLSLYSAPCPRKSLCLRKQDHLSPHTITPQHALQSFTAGQRRETKRSSLAISQHHMANTRPAGAAIMTRQEDNKVSMNAQARSPTTKASCGTCSAHSSEASCPDSLPRTHTFLQQ